MEGIDPHRFAGAVNDGEAAFLVVCFECCCPEMDGWGVCVVGLFFEFFDVFFDVQVAGLFFFFDEVVEVDSDHFEFVGVFAEVGFVGGFDAVFISDVADLLGGGGFFEFVAVVKDDVFNLVPAVSAHGVVSFLLLVFSLSSSLGRASSGAGNVSRILMSESRHWPLIFVHATM